MARTWSYTRRNRIPLALLDLAGRTVASAMRVLTRREPDGGEVRRILVIEFWNIGDVILTTPFLRGLRERFPEASITFLGRPHAAELLEGSGLVDEVIVIDVPWTASRRKYDPTRYDVRAMRRLFATLRARHFDLAFESRMDPRAKFVLALTGARRRIAYDLGGCNWLLTDAVETGSLERHRSDDWLGLLAPLGDRRNTARPRLVVSDMEAAWAREWLRAHGIEGDDRVVAIHPGASSPCKRWPVERFAEVARWLQRDRAARVVAIEDPDGQGGELSRLPGVVSIRPTLRQLMAILASVDVVVCNDSGPMHIAAAVGTPTVGIFHPHAAREFYPLGEGHQVLTPSGASREFPAKGPTADALLGVSINDVKDGVSAVLDSRARARRATG